MNAKVLREVVIVLAVFAIVLLVAVEKVYAPPGGNNEDPVAVLVVEANCVAVDEDVLFVGSGSYDPDGNIIKYEWDFDYDANIGFEADYWETANRHTDGAFDGNTTHSYSSVGLHTAALKVTDDADGKAGTDVNTCTVCVAQFDRYYVEPDGNDGEDGLSWETAFATVQKAIGESIPGDEIWVAAGTYTPTEGTDRAVSLELKDFTKVYGGFAGDETELDERDWETFETILSGDIGIGSDANDNSYHVVVGADNAALDGFTITGGNADVGGPYSYGGGIYCNGVVGLTVKNCLIKNNNAANRGGGMYNDTSEVTVENCSFVANGTFVRGGGVENMYGSSVFTNCVFSENSGSVGGGFSDGDSDSILTGCTFSKNQAGYIGGGAILSNYYSNTMVVNCSFNDNSASSVGGAIRIDTLSNLILSNSVFSDNSASTSGGAIYDNGGGTSAVTNCTFTGNEAIESGGGIRDNDWSTSPRNLTLTNCIFWGNKDTYDPCTGEWLTDETAQVSGFMESVTYSCIQDANANDSNVPFGGAANNNIDDDPKFEDAGNPAGADGVFGTVDDGLRLLTGSPCVDGADSTAAGFQSTDITGRAHIDIPYVENTGEGDIDWGDFGYIGSSTVWYVDDSMPSDDGDGTSWTEAFKYLQDALAVAIASDEIWIAAGVYKPDDGLANPPANVGFELNEGVTIRGGYAGRMASLPYSDYYHSEQNLLRYRTTLSGDIGGDDGPNFTNRDDNSYHVVKVVPDGNPSVENPTGLDGVIIRGGHANGSGDDEYGGGIYCDGISPTISKCVIRDNWAYTSGGGISCTNGGAIISECTIEENECEHDDGGGIYCSNVTGTMKVEDCVIKSNSCDEYGGGMGVYNCAEEVKINNCVFRDNSGYRGGGAANRCDEDGTISKIKITDCVFNGNNAGYCGGGVYNGPWGDGYDTVSTLSNIINCVFANNTAGDRGGGLYVRATPPDISSAEVMNCTFSGNVAVTTNGGGAAKYLYETLTVTNCILWGNTDVGPTDESAQIYSAGGTPPDVSYSCIQGLSVFGSEPSNIGDDPLFVNSEEPAGWDGEFYTWDDGLRIMAYSPCVDVANAGATGFPAQDIRGQGRIDVPVASGGAGVPAYADMGAYESPVVWFVKDGASGYTPSVLASWSNAFGELYDALDNASLASGDEIWVAGNAGAYEPSIFSWTFALVGNVGFYGGFEGENTVPQERDFTTYETILKGNSVDDTIIDNGDAGTSSSGTWSVSSASNPYGTDSLESTDAGATYSWTATINGKRTVYMWWTWKTGRTACNVEIWDGGTRVLETVLPQDELLTAGKWQSLGSYEFNNNTAEVKIICPEGGNISADAVKFVGKSYDVVTGADQSVLDGFTVRDGINNGMYNSGCTGRINNCRFVENGLTGMYNYMSGPTISNCSFSQNGSGELVSYRGGGMHNSGKPLPTVTNCTFTKNFAKHGAGMYCMGSGTATVTDCFFSENRSADRGAGIYCRYAPLVLTNCVFAGNEAGGHGGGMYILGDDDARAWLRNCTFSKNMTWQQGGGFAIEGRIGEQTVAYLYNCILWDNYCIWDYWEWPQGNDIFEFLYGGWTTVIGRYTCIRDKGGLCCVYPAIEGDPLFADAAIAYWRMDDSRDNTIVVDRWRRNHGEASRATENMCVDGQVDKALAFNGSDYINCGNRSPLHFDESSAYTWMGWFNTDDQTQNQEIISKKTGLDSGYSISIAGGLLEFKKFESGSASTIVSYSGLSSGIGFHFAVTYDPVNESAKMYINGEPEGSGSTAGFVSDASSDVIIGDGFKGTLDELMIFGKVLSDTEVEAHSDRVVVDEESYDSAAGLDGILGTGDDGLSLQEGSSCIDAAIGEHALARDIVGTGRFDVVGVINEGVGNPDYVDAGAYETMLARAVIMCWINEASPSYYYYEDNFNGDYDLYLDGLNHLQHPEHIKSGCLVPLPSGDFTTIEGVLPEGYLDDPTPETFIAPEEPPVGIGIYPRSRTLNVEDIKSDFHMIRGSIVPEYLILIVDGSGSMKYANIDYDGFKTWIKNPSGDSPCPNVDIRERVFYSERWVEEMATMLEELNEYIASLVGN